MTANTVSARGPIPTSSVKLADPDGGIRFPFTGPDGGWRFPVTEPEAGWRRGG